MPNSINPNTSVSWIQAGSTPEQQAKFIQRTLGNSVVVVAQNPGSGVTKATVWVSQSNSNMLALQLPGERPRLFSSLTELQNALPSAGASSIMASSSASALDPAQRRAAMQRELGPDVDVVDKNPGREVTKPTVWPSQSQPGKLALQLPGETQIDTFSSLSELRNALPSAGASSIMASSPASALNSAAAMQEALGPDVAVVEKNPGSEVTKPTVWPSQSQPGKLVLKMRDEPPRIFESLSELQNALASVEASAMESLSNVQFPSIPGAANEKTTNNDDEELEKRLAALIKDDFRILEKNITSLQKEEKRLAEDGKKLEAELKEAREKRTSLQKALPDYQKILEDRKNSLRELKNGPKSILPYPPGQGSIGLEERHLKLAADEVETLSEQIAQIGEQIKTIEENQATLTREQAETGLRRRLAERERTYRKEASEALSQGISQDPFMTGIEAEIPEELTKVEDIFYHIKRNFSQPIFDAVWEEYTKGVPLEEGATLSQTRINSMNRALKNLTDIEAKQRSKN